MAQPPPYDAATFATRPFDANLRPLLDAEFAKIEASLDDLIANIEQIQRDDTLLKNGSVHVDALSQAVLDLISGASGGVLAYLLDGSRALTGDMDAGGKAITNVGNVDGRDVSVDGTKLDGVEAEAKDDQTDAEIATGYNSQVAAASQAEAEAGTETAIRRLSPLRLAQAIAALAPAAGDLSNLVEDTTPQLGGNLDLNGFGILTGYVTESGTSFTLSNTHRGKRVLCTNAAGCTVTLPADATDDLVDGYVTVLIQMGAGQILLDDDTGATTIQVPASYRLRSAEQFAFVSVEKRTTDTFFVGGELEIRATETMEVQLFDTNSTVTVGLNPGNNLIIVPAAMNGMNLSEVMAAVETPGTGTGTTDIQLVRVRDGVSANTLSVELTIDPDDEDSLTAGTGYDIDETNDDLLEGDRFRPNVTGVSSTPPVGLTMIITAQTPL